MKSPRTAPQAEGLEENKKERMNATPTDADNQAGTYNRFACAGCGALTAEAGCETIRSKRMPPGEYAFACHRCARRAKISPRFRRQVEIIAASRQSMPEVARVFASIGVFDIPTTLLEYDEALGLAPGSTAAAVAGGL